MKLWKRISKPTAENPAGPAASPDSASTPTSPVGSTDPAEQVALDQLASVLRILGKYAFDLDEIKATTLADQLERWCVHILTAAPLKPAPADSTPAPQPNARRDWGGLRDFLTRMRRSEQAYVNRQIVVTRQVMGEFVKTVGLALAEDQQEQTQVMAVVERLRQTIEQNAPLEVLSREALAAVESITEIARERERRNQALLAELNHRLQNLRGELDEVRRETELDALTQVANRKAFDRQIERIFELSKLSGEPACLVMVDADHFKRINDTYGHPAGDHVLKELAKACTKGFPRKSDVVARYGGEEFAVILPDTALTQALPLAERLLNTVRIMRLEYEGQELDITVSIGIAELRDQATPDEWLKDADTALYQAKNNGRDRIVTSP